MNKLAYKVKEYLEKVLGVSIIIQNFRVSGLPYFLYDQFDYYKIEMYNQHIIAVIDKEVNELTPENLKKQIEIISEKAGLEVIYVNEKISSFQRNRLIKYKVNFVVPNNQMYLPYLKIDLREYFRSSKIKKKSLTPASQAIIILSILNNYSQLDSELVMSRLEYSGMSVSRSFKEISNLEIGNLERYGKKKILNLPNDKKHLWEISKNFMSSPVNQEIWIKHFLTKQNLISAGISALSCYSLISPPRNQVIAIYKKEWYKLKNEVSIKELIEPNQTESNIKLQIWSYPPNLLKNNDNVDKYSLYLSLQNDKDERVEQALKDMMEDKRNG